MKKIAALFYLIQKIYNGSVIVSFLHDPKRDYHYLQIVFSRLRPLPWLKRNYSEFILSFHETFNDEQSSLFLRSLKQPIFRDVITGSLANDL